MTRLIHLLPKYTTISITICLECSIRNTSTSSFKLRDRPRFLNLPNRTLLKAKE
jgi:hypothetical protein